MSGREICLLAVACTFAGIAAGFLLAPIKAGLTVSCGNNNTVRPPVRGVGRRTKDEEPEDPC